MCCKFFFFFLLSFTLKLHIWLSKRIGHVVSLVKVSKLCMESGLCYVFIIPLLGIIAKLWWPHGVRRKSAAARLLRLWVRIPPGAGMFVCCACCVLSGRGLCDELITRPEESYRLCCVVYVI